MGEPLRVDVVFDFVCPWCAHQVKVLLEAMEQATTTEAALVTKLERR